MLKNLSLSQYLKQDLLLFDTACVHVNMAPTTKSAKSKFEHQVKQKRICEREKQLREAVQYCITNNCRGSAAISAGVCPKIKSRITIDKRLDGVLPIGKEKEYCQVLTNAEEDLLVQFVKHKCQALQPTKRRELNQIIIKMLKLRAATNKKMKGGRKYIPLSDSAKSALSRGHVGRAFCVRFDMKHADITQRHPSPVSLKRVLACTKEMAMSHLDNLAEELIAAGIFTNAVQLEPGVWEGNIDTSRIYNHDETPQFVRYGQGGAAPELVYCEKGKECKQYVAENRECVTVHPFVSLDGSLVLCHVIFKGEAINSNMVTSNAVEKIDNLFISTTESGSQDGRSCYEVHKFFNSNVADDSKKPLVMLTDGH